MDKKMNGKIIIRSDLKVLTGLHIGGSDAYSAIGTVDSPVIKSSRDNRPIVPGSSLKGKIRTLLAAVLDNETQYKNHNDDVDVIKRLFGCTKPNITPARLQFSDAYIKDADKVSISSLTEVKFENTINRGDCQANPRQIERVVPGVVFETVIVYNVENDNETKEDLKTLAEGMKLLQYDYLGGHGSRGSGRISFENIEIETVNNDSIDSGKIKEIFKDVEDHELLHI